ncbi:MAG TPA: isoprenylcysteine carboxylmethyltransferase family protein [Gemmatimonadaceae bacterium]|nr:isoprenylcysteine carboxylmethyltransferase family protein [Gemmatimonadaceae bacterium]
MAAPNPAPPDSDTAGVIAFPPLIVAGTLALGLIAHWLWPRHPFPTAASRIAGIVMVVAGGAIIAWGAKTMRAAGTNIDPNQPALALVTTGPFRYTRNPLYLANVIIYLGTTLVVDALWPFVLLVPLVALLEWGVIRREERYLTRLFGAPYDAYRHRVRRWI